MIALGAVLLVIIWLWYRVWGPRHQQYLALLLLTMVLAYVVWGMKS